MTFNLSNHKNKKIIMFEKIKYASLTVIMVLGFAFSSSGQASVGGSGGDIYDNRLCSVKPGENKSTECQIVNPHGLCTIYSTCP
jgi:hypothetical protein